MIFWYGRDGKPLFSPEIETSSPEWIEEMKKVEKLLTDKEYKVVAQDYTPGKKFWVSTVWLGLDHDFLYPDAHFLHKPNPRPIIFETMVFDERPENQQATGDLFPPGTTISPEKDMRRYRTEAEARRGHAAMLKKWTRKEAKL